MIHVTKTYLPSFEEYTRILRRAWDKGWITNNGELVQELEQSLKDYLEVDRLFFCGNGTIVLQMALKALNINKEVITTPFSYVATTNSILWENCIPVFADIEPDTLCIDPKQIEKAITINTEAILATHVYGLPCNIKAIEAIAIKHGLKVIYDGAHAFGCRLNGKPLLSYGDISTCSFHATKLFHTVEGGCIVLNNDEIAQKILLYRSFGHISDDYYSVGINGKNSEFHAAMGLAILPKIRDLINERKKIFSMYDSLLPDSLIRPSFSLPDFEYNYSYLPVVFETENTLLKVKDALANEEIYMRRYFYPSLNCLPQVKFCESHCPVSEDISRRIACLPLYVGLQEQEIESIIRLIKQNV